MVKSKIIKEFVSEDISLEVALKRLILFANDLSDSDLSYWVDKELSGYNQEDEIPEYRKFKSPKFVYSGINGSYQVTRQPVPAGGLAYKDFDSKKLEEIFVLEPIATIIEKSKSKERLSRDMSALTSVLEENTRQMDGLPGIQAFSIVQIIDPSQLAEIVEQLKQRVLKILLKLESEYGNLDNMDIATDDNNQLNRVQQEISQIIFQGTTVVNNNFQKAKFKGNLAINSNDNDMNAGNKIKDSNIGAGSNEVEKLTEIDLKPQSSSIFSKLKKIFGF